MNGRTKKADRIFDGWAERFHHRIYAADNPKGQIRQHILRRDLQSHVFAGSGKHLDIIDIGGGLGQMAIWLARWGHRVVLSEPSADMLEQAVKNAAEAKVETLQFEQYSLQTLPGHFYKSFDLVICHAVLEWMAEPRTAVAQLKSLMRDNASLSLMFYNRHSARMRSLIVGDFIRANSNHLAGDGEKRLAPISPLDPMEVADWIMEQSLRIQHWSGIRCFYDYMLPDVRLKADIKDVLHTEANLSTRQPWRQIARYQHLICKKSTPAAR